MHATAQSDIASSAAEGAARPKEQSSRRRSTAEAEAQQKPKRSGWREKSGIDHEVGQRSHTNKRFSRHARAKKSPCVQSTSARRAQQHLGAQQWTHHVWKRVDDGTSGGQTRQATSRKRRHRIGAAANAQSV